MGRRKGYQPEELVKAAMALFHVHGFAGTSTEMLVETLGVNRNSMYSEFGSKQALFDACLDRYDRDVVTSIFGALEADGADLETIHELFEGFGAAAVGGAGLGCLICNTAVELAGDDPSGDRVVQKYLHRIHAAFRNALDGARAAGVLVKEIDVDDEARFLTATCLGIFVMVRARSAPATLRSVVSAATRHLASLRCAEL